MNDEVNRTQPLPDDVAIYLKKEEGGGVHMAFWPPLSPSLMDDLEHDQEIFFLIVRIEITISFSVLKLSGKN